MCTPFQKVSVCGLVTVLHSTLWREGWGMSLCVTGRQLASPSALSSSPGAPRRWERSRIGLKSQLYKHSLPRSQGGKENCPKGDLGKIAESNHPLKRT